MQRCFVNSKENNNFILDENDSYHLTKVMRMKKNDLVEVVYDNDVYLTKIIDFNPIKVSIIKKINSINSLILKITICQSLVKESKMDLILEKSTELGAYSFIPLKVKNSIIKGSDNDFKKKVIRWSKIVESASCQSKRNNIPLVNEVLRIDEVIELDFDLKILCTVNEVSRSLKNILQNNKNYGTMIIVIGPEGGFTKEEEEKFKVNGFVSASLGNLVLRTETASICALSMINYEFER